MCETINILGLQPTQHINAPRPGNENPEFSDVELIDKLDTTLPLLFKLHVFIVCLGDGSLT